MKTPIKIAILDDHSVARHGLSLALGNMDNVKVAGVYDNSQSLLEAIDQEPIDMALVDYSLSPGCIDGLALIRILRKRWPNLLTLMVSSYDDVLTTEQCLKQGAHGFFSKGQQVHELSTAINTLLEGGRYVPPSLQLPSEKT